MKLPPHKCELSITHNAHTVNYTTIAEHLAFFDTTAERCGLPQEEFEALCAGDELWEIQWYPDNPITSHYVAAATLERALELANRGSP